MERILIPIQKLRHSLTSFQPPEPVLTAWEKLRTRAKLPEAPRAAAEKRALLQELDETLYDLRCARALFEQASAPELVEASVYQIKSAESRYNYLLRKAKEIGLTQLSLQRRRTF